MGVNYTPFGQLLVKRLQVRDSNVTALAESIGVTLGFLSNVCLGKKVLPECRLEQIFSAMQADARERRNMEEAWWISNHQMHTDWENYDMLDRLFLYRVIHQFKDTPRGKRDKILALLGDSQEEEDSLLW